jgi:hypothetical protein
MSNHESTSPNSPSTTNATSHAEVNPGQPNPAPIPNPAKSTPRRAPRTISQFPKSQRDQISLLLRDGLLHTDIIKQLAERGIVLTDRQLAQWARGGYQDWLEAIRWVDRVKVIREFAREIVRLNKGQAIQEAALHVAAGHIYDLLTTLKPGSLNKKFKGDPENYARIIRALALISGGGLKHEEYRAKVAEIKAAIEREIKAVPEGSGLPAETLRSIEQQIGLL